MGQSDGLSRQGTTAHTKLDNDNIILLDNWLWILPIYSPTQFILELVKGWKRRQIWQEVTIHSIETPTIEQQILIEYPKDIITSQALKALLDRKETPPLNTKITQWKLHDRLLSKDERLYVPDNDEVK